MGLRETMNEKPAVAAIVAGALIAVALGVILWSTGMIGGGGAPGGAEGIGDAKRYYTTDDGKTYFADSYNKIPPYEKDGKTAVLAKVFKDNDNNGALFVGYLTRHTPEAKRMMEERQKKGAAGDFGPIEAAGGGIEYKKPLTGDAGWLRSGDPRVTQLLESLKSPKGSQNIEEVFPE
jgi:hypothetical protein